MKRVVKLTFKEDKINQFKEFIAQYKENVAQFEGCESIAIFQDLDNSQIFFTISEWTSLVALEKYRDSEMFKQTWTKVKPWFDMKANAWSLVSL